jgi:hypothetical protein
MHYHVTQHHSRASTDQLELQCLQQLDSSLCSGSQCPYGLAGLAPVVFMMHHIMQDGPLGETIVFSAEQYSSTYSYSKCALQ